MFNQFERSFKDGLLELLYLDPNLGALARGMGMPVVDNSVSTAALKWDKREKKIVFAVSEEFLENSDEEMVASVILHETEHLIFDHVSERIEDLFPDKKVLHMAQECINNDIIDTIYQLPLPDDAITGRDLLQKDCTSMSTKQVYDLIVQQMPPQEGDGEGDPNGGPSQKSGKGQKGQGGGKGQPGDEEDDQDGEGDESEDQDDQHDHQKGGCGGIQVDDEDVFDVEDYLKDLIKKTADEKKMTPEELMDEINNTKSSGYSPTGAKISEKNSPSPTRMNWNQLLAKINPKVLEAGKKTKVKYDWTKQNRRLVSVYPTAIIPKIKTKDPKPSDKGDSIPVLVIALDLSGSIPRTLVKMLQGLLEDIPEKLIKAYPCTWGSYLFPYTGPDSHLGSGGTDIDKVSAYVQKIKEETHTDPYVLVITDGEFHAHFARPGKDWYFMAVNDYSLRDCRQHAKDDEHLYNVKDFQA